MNLEYSVIYSKRKSLSIFIDRDSSVIVRAPIKISQEKIDREVQKHKKLIQEKISRKLSISIQNQTKEFVSGESLLYLGRHYQLEIVEEPFNGIKFDNKFFISKENKQNANQLFRDWFIKSAKELFIPKVDFYAKQIGVTVNKVNILSLRYRWGSCTPKDNIHLNWRLIKAPMTVINYIIVHELIHLIEPNHSTEFWNRVSIQLPAYEKAKLWLKENGRGLEKDF